MKKNSLLIFCLWIAGNMSVFAEHDSCECIIMNAHHYLSRAGHELEALADKTKALSEESSGELSKRYQHLSHDYLRMARYCQKEGKKQKRARYYYPDYKKLNKQREEIAESVERLVAVGGTDPHKCSKQESLPFKQSRKIKSDEGQSDSFSKAAEVYRKKAKEFRGYAEKETGRLSEIYSQVAENYDKLAAIKSIARDAQQAGVPFDWSEYESVKNKNLKLFKEAKKLSRTSKKDRSPKGSLEDDAEHYRKRAEGLRYSAQKLEGRLKDVVLEIADNCDRLADLKESGEESSSQYEALKKENGLLGREYKELRGFSVKPNRFAPACEDKDDSSSEEDEEGLEDDGWDH